MNMEKIIKIAFGFLALLAGAAIYLAITIKHSMHDVNSSVKSTTVPATTDQNNTQINPIPTQVKQIEENITALPVKQAAQQADTSVDKKAKVSEKPKEAKNIKKENRRVGNEDDPAIGQGQKFKPNTIIPKGE